MASSPLKVRGAALALLVLAAACARPDGPLAPGIQPPPPPPPPPPPRPPAATIPLAGLTSAVGGDHEVAVHFRLPGPGFEAALFAANDRTRVHAGTPVAQTLTSDRFAWTGLDNGVDWWLGLGVRAAGTSAYSPGGIVLHARTGPPIHVDAQSTAATPDGRTPATAFRDLAAGLAAASAQGGGNVWVRDGLYVTPTLTPLPGVHVYGGFAGDFRAATRSLPQLGTVLRGSAAQAIFLVQGGFPGGQDVVLDGLALDGTGGAALGVDGHDTPLELRSLGATGFADRGLRVTSTALFGSIETRLAACTASGNAADGLYAAGALDLRIDGSRFERNGQEGIELDDLVAPDGLTAVLHVTESRCYGNGSEGLDADLAAPPLPGPTPGRFDVQVRGSSFERNALDGLLLDLDYDFVAGWLADIQVRECAARANGRAGFHLDVDNPAHTWLHRLLAAANQGDGILLTSESDPGFVLATHCAAMGNLGAGLRASQGQKALLAAHCALAGSFGGGLASDVVESAAASCVAHLQAGAFANARVVASPQVQDPLAAVFVRAPAAYDRVLAVTASTLTLASGVAASSLTAELADDGSARTVVSASGTSVLVDPAPQGLATPALLALFAPGGRVDEDWQLAQGSGLTASGMTSPAGPPVAPGPLGGNGGGPPGVADPLSTTFLRPLATTPPVSQGISGQQPLQIDFDAALDQSSLTAHVRAIDAAGAPLAVGLSAAGAQLRVTPPPAGWGSGPVVVELHQGLRGQSGAQLAAGLVLPVQAF